MFCLSFPLTDLIAGTTDMVLWYKVKQIIYNVCIGVAFFIAGYQSKDWAKFILHIGLGIVVSDIIDRVFFDVTTWNNYDILLLAINLIVCSYKNIHLLCRIKT